MEAEKKYAAMKQAIALTSCFPVYGLFTFFALRVRLHSVEKIPSSPVIGRNVKPTKHLRRSDGLVKRNSETVLLLKKELDSTLLASAQVSYDQRIILSLPWAVVNKGRFPFNRNGTKISLESFWNSGKSENCPKISER